MKKGKISVVTAYDFPSAVFAKEAGIDWLLVGDSAANTMMGLDSTRKISMNEMLVFVKAAAKSGHPFVIADMPYKSYKGGKTALKNAKEFIEAGAKAVKIEGAKIKIVKKLVECSIPVMGHLGYLPQSMSKPKVQGKEKKAAGKILREAALLEEAGCFSIVLELVPSVLAKKITESVSVPTIGIGAGKHCSGQVLVWHDLLGIGTESRKFRHVKRFENLRPRTIAALKKFKAEVRAGKFPSAKNSF